MCCEERTVGRFKVNNPVAAEREWEVVFSSRGK